MENLPDLDQLSLAEKDDLIRSLFARVKALMAHVDAMNVKVVELEGRLALNSHNSSKPPSTDGLNKPKPKSLREVRPETDGRSNGAHRPHPEASRAPGLPRTLPGPPSHCDACHRPLTDAVVVETRQVFDLSPLRHEVTEHQLLEARCACGKMHRGRFPVAVSAT